MLFKSSALIVAAVVALSSSGVFADEGDVFTATRIFQERVTTAPFLVDRTTVITWTQGPTITESTPITPIPTTIQTVAAVSAV